MSKHIEVISSPRGGGGGGITVLCHFRKNDLMPVISCLTSLTFWSIFHVISIPFCPKTRIGPSFKRNNSLCDSLVRQIGLPMISFQWHLCLIEDVTQMWQDPYQILKYYIIKCYIFCILWHALGHFYENDRILLFPDWCSSTPH